MRVIAILGSPRKGDSLCLTERFEASLKKIVPVDIQYIHLREANLEMCRGCFLCITKGEHLCPLKDRREEIEQQMLYADGVIFVSPVYSMMVSALMKNFIDRFSFMAHRPRFWNQSAAVLVTSCGGGIPETIKYLTGLARAWGFYVVGNLGVATHPAFRNETKEQEKIDALAARFAMALTTKTRPAPSLTEVLTFNFMRANAKGAAEVFPADAQYYKDHGWMESSFFTASPVNPIKTAVATIMLKVFDLVMSR